MAPRGQFQASLVLVTLIGLIGFPTALLLGPSIALGRDQPKTGAIPSGASASKERIDDPLNLLSCPGALG